MSPDYARLYHEYWSRPDRWGSSSFSDPAGLCDRVLKACGGGRMLDVGCGMGVLVHALLKRGVDAQGVDVSQLTVDHANTQAPGRFRTASGLGLPFADGEFETVICTDVLEHLEESDVPAFVRELARVTRRGLFVTLSTAIDRDRRWHLTIRDRQWWERQFIEAGLRRHPRSQLVVEYESLETEGPQVTLVYEHIPSEARIRYPLAALAAERDLHMDMLREPGRRSDAHIARYTLALPFVRAGDTVLDVACGLGYGTAILTQGSQARRVIGVDNSAYAIEYARANYSADNPACAFHLGDAAGLKILADASVDLIVCMETLEHVASPEVFLAELDRVLRPSGRLIVSVPNQWVDETGHDPNPHHLSVYDWPKLRDQLSAHFLLETAFAQTAGGALKCRDQTRKLKALSPQNIGDADPEWWIAVAMKSPVADARATYVETCFPAWSNAPDCNIASFARDYGNPWLVKAMVSIGMRATQPALLEQIANDVLHAARPGSADAGAALCVLAYRLLEAPGTTAAAIQTHINRIAAYHAQADDNPHAWRWRISNEYIAGRLWMSLGNRAAAREAFLACAALDPLRFSPLLATKTVDALFLAGLLAAGDGDLTAARDCWQRGLTETRRVLQGDWRNIWGAADSPATFGLPEVAQIADLATRCSFGLNALEYWRERPAQAWTLAQTNQARELAGWRQMAGELRQWAQESNKGREWLEGQVRSWQATAEANAAQVAAISQRDQMIVDLKNWINQLESGKRWLEEQRAAHEAEARQAHADNNELRAWCAEQDKAIKWNAGQNQHLLEEIKRLEREIEQLRTRESHLQEQLRQA